MKSLALLLLPLALAGNERVERQLEHPWGRWQPGAWVETRTASTERPQGLLEKSRLVRFDQTGYVLASSLYIKGGDDVEMEQHQSWGYGGFAHVMPNAQMVGHDTVKVGTKTYECEMYEASWQERKETMVCRSWVAPELDVPLRWRMAAPSGGVEVTLVDPNDFVKIQGRKVRAARYEGNGRMPSGSVSLRDWFSLDVPGGMVRRETRTGDTTVLREVTSFRCVPLAPR